MKHTKCKICGKEHALGGCPEFQSTASRKDEISTPQIGGSVDSATSVRDKAMAPLSSLPAGTQALPVDTQIDSWTSAIIQKHNERLAYQAQYQRDLRAATKLGISVKEFRAAKVKGISE